MQGPMRHCAALLLLCGGAMLGGCTPEQVLGSNALPPDVSDPAVARTPDGALATYRGAVDLFRRAFAGRTSTNGPNSGVILPTALLTDELEDSDIGLVGTSYSLMPFDARQLPEYTDPAIEQPRSGAYRLPYGMLQQTRGQIQEALGALARA